MFFKYKQHIIHTDMIIFTTPQFHDEKHSGYFSIVQDTTPHGR